MPERVSRMNGGITVKPSVTVGSTKFASVSEPEIGSQRNVTPNTTIRIRPNQKLGMAWPNTASASAPRSTMLLARTAATIPSGTADHEREDDRHDRELEGDADALGNELRHRLVGEQRAAEVAGQRVAGPVDVLDVERPIEAVAMRDLGDLRRPRVVARELVGKVARQAQQAKADHRHGERNEDGDDQPPHDESAHGGPARVRVSDETMRALLEGAAGLTTSEVLGPRPEEEGARSVWGAGVGVLARTHDPYGRAPQHEAEAIQALSG